MIGGVAINMINNVSGPLAGLHRPYYAVRWILVTKKTNTEIASVAIALAGSLPGKTAIPPLCMAGRLALLRGLKEFTVTFAPI